MIRQSYSDIEPEVSGPLPCDHCGRDTPAWALYLSQGSEPDGFICGLCIAEHADKTSLPEPEPTDPWETERGKHLKAERNLSLSYDATGWAIMPDAPITDRSKSAILAYRALLNRMTVDSTPETWVWPERPELEYPA